MKNKKTTIRKMFLTAITVLTASSALFAQGNSQNNNNALWHAKGADTVSTNREVLINKNLNVQGNAAADNMHILNQLKIGNSSMYLGNDPAIGGPEEIKTTSGQIAFGGTDITGTTFTSDIRIGIGTTNPTEKLHIKDGSIYVEGEGQGIIVNEGGHKRVGLMKYYGREAGIWRVINQDFEIGRLNVPSLPGIPTIFTIDLYIPCWRKFVTCA